MHKVHLTLGHVLSHFQGNGKAARVGRCPDDFLPSIRRRDKETPNDSRKQKRETSKEHKCSGRKIVPMVKLDFDSKEEGGSKEEEGAG